MALRINLFGFADSPIKHKWKEKIPKQTTLYHECPYRIDKLFLISPTEKNIDQLISASGNK